NIDFLLSVDIVVFLIFFFKQKTAYEIETGLEFRRVLFRSHFGFRSSYHYGLRNKQFYRYAVLRISVSIQIQIDNLRYSSLIHMRSEERRVGKECRSWWYYLHVTERKERVK